MTNKIEKGLRPCDRTMCYLDAEYEGKDKDGDTMFYCPKHARAEGWIGVIDASEAKE